MLLIVSPAFAQQPTACPPGYVCTPDPNLSDWQRRQAESDRASQEATRRLNCELDEELAVDSAARVYPGDPAAAANALASTRVLSPSCRRRSLSRHLVSAAPGRRTCLPAIRPISLLV